MSVHASSLRRPPASRGGSSPTPSLRRVAGSTVTPLRTGRCIELGGLAERRLVGGCQLVAALDLDGTTWWLPEAAVWHDAACAHPEACTDAHHRTDHPVATGLATARNRDAAMLAGLSDRLGWEAVLHLERTDDLPALADTRALDDAGIERGKVVVLDGRLAHDVPTVVALGPGLVRWGAGCTWASALRRALFTSRSPGGDHTAELVGMTERLDRAGLRPVLVDVGSDVLRAGGVTRGSLQLLTD